MHLLILFIFVMFANFHDAYADFPENDLHLEDEYGLTSMTEAQFNSIINAVEKVYDPIVAKHGATLNFNRRWTDPTVNASAGQVDKAWNVNMYGGLARRTEVTADGFALVVCHELGHHLAGFPTYAGESWAANEGQSDYFATHECIKKAFAVIPASSPAPAPEPFVKQRCDCAYSSYAARNRCYRSTAAGQSLANLLSAMRRSPTPPTFETPDLSVVAETQDGHPDAQCRLDTYLAGALCRVNFNRSLIPSSESEAFKYSCSQAEYAIGYRSRCWFAPSKQR